MKILAAFLLGIVLAGGLVWVMSDSDAQREVRELGNDVGDGMHQAKEGIKDAVGGIDTAELKRDMKATGREVVDTTKEMFSDASITASIKVKLAASDDVSALSIDVDTTDGLVTLSGKVDSMEEIRRAVEIASGVEGVKQVMSTLQVKLGS